MRLAMLWLLSSCLVVSILGLVPSSITSANSISLDNDAPTATIHVTPSETVLGTTLRWQLSVSNAGQDKVTILDIQPGDPDAWQVVSPPAFPIDVADSLVLDLSVISLRRGSLRPSIRTTYTVNTMTVSTIDEAPDTVMVISVPELIDFALYPVQSQAAIQDSVQFTLHAHNNTPFAVEIAKIDLTGIDVQPVAPLPPAVTLQPWQAESVVVSAMVTGKHPQPVMFVDYLWDDETGTTQTHTTDLTGSAMEVPDTILGIVWDETLRTLTPIVLGVLFGIGTSIILDMLAKRRRQADNRDRLFGLLRRLVDNALVATREASLVNLDALDKIFYEEGLYVILRKEDLVEPTRKFWDAAEKYNKGLLHTEGTSRAQAVHVQADALRKKLDQTESPPKFT